MAQNIYDDEWAIELERPQFMLAGANRQAR
jgi:hypothetical protein